MRSPCKPAASSRGCSAEMGVTVSEQLCRLCASLLTGAALAVLYDVLRAIRRKLPQSSALFDVVFSAAAILALFTLGMSAGGGTLYLSMVIFVLLGFSLWMLSLSRLFLPLFIKIAELLLLALSPLDFVIKKAVKLAKNIFPKIRIWYNIKRKRETTHTDGGGELETEEYSGAHRSYYTPAAALRGGEPAVGDGSASRGRADGDKSAARDRRSRSRKCRSSHKNQRS